MYACRKMRFFLSTDKCHIHTGHNILYGAIQVLHNAIFLDIGHPPTSRNANNGDPYTSVTLFHVTKLFWYGCRCVQKVVKIVCRRLTMLTVSNIF